MNINDTKRVEYYNPKDPLHKATTFNAILTLALLIAVIGWVLAGGEI